MKVSFKPVLVTVTLLLSMPLFSRAASAPAKIVVTYGGLNERSGVLFVAKDAGIFQKHGLDAQVVNVRSGAVGLSALAAGETQFHGGSATGASIGAMAGGLDLVFVAGLINKLDGTFVVAPNIKTPADLKGKKIGVTTFGSLTDFLVRYALQKKGLNPQRDVALIQIGGDPERIGALKQGSIDAASLSFPGYGIAMKMGFPMLWASAKDINYHWIEITTRRSIIQKDRELVMNYMKAHLEATALFKRDRDFGKKVIKKTLRLDNEELVNESYDLFAKAFLSTPYPNMSWMKTSFEYVAMTRPDVLDHKPEEYVDRSFVEELDKSGFIKKLYEK